jgi:3-hydroxy acid dehydrogenase / malonic semialdehyde reductase
VVRFDGDKEKADAVYAYVRLVSISTNLANISRGCDPLTPDDIAEVVVFTAGRRENVVVADTLIYPNHQV